MHPAAHMALSREWLGVPGKVPAPAWGAHGPHLASSLVTEHLAEGLGCTSTGNPANVIPSCCQKGKAWLPHPMPLGHKALLSPVVVLACIGLCWGNSTSWKHQKDFSPLPPFCRYNFILVLGVMSSCEGIQWSPQLAQRKHTSSHKLLAVQAKPFFRHQTHTSSHGMYSVHHQNYFRCKWEKLWSDLIFVPPFFFFFFQKQFNCWHVKSAFDHYV